MISQILSACLFVAQTTHLLCLDDAGSAANKNEEYLVLDRQRSEQESETTHAPNSEEQLSGVHGTPYASVSIRLHRRSLHR